MSHDSTQDFLIALERLPGLPTGQRGDWFEKITSRWIDGVFYRDRQDPHVVVALCRGAGFEVGEDPYIDYDVQIHLADASVTMCPQSAIALGHHLIAAGTAGMRDMAKQTGFLAQADTYRDEPPASRIAEDLDEPESSEPW